MSKIKNGKKDVKRENCGVGRIKYKLNFDMLYDRKEVKNE